MVGWLWRSGRIGNKLGFSPSCFSGLVAERAKGRTENIGGEVEPTTLCG
jgi:hypothetical protein